MRCYRSISTDAHGHALDTFIRKERSDLDRGRIRKALTVAKSAHAGEKRESGHPSVTHPIAVATMVAEAGGTTEAVIVSLLHDTVEDTALGLEDIERFFGRFVARSVELLTKTSPEDTPPVMKLSTPRVLRNVDSLTGAVRTAMLVKVYDRIHNLQTASALPLWRRVRMADETVSAIVPFACALNDRRAAGTLVRLAAEQRPAA